ncbi:hypothetical protein GWQ43_19850 (plasmid) [Alcaligenes faecalis]|uniref:hypothetical protein n=1 Tax=Alcaligenes faecalis TaxID=511 RepID=UPI00137BBB0F|nr:hypothetical protein [Alcaligenes faecalis]QHS38423.1 hypothetical protein GWQ43_19850 [Alcaligenes faecalis]
MKQTTKQLIAHFRIVNKHIVQVDVSKYPSDSDFIHFEGGYELIIDDDAALPTVLLEEKMHVGGNVNIASWVIDKDAILGEVATAVAKLYSGLRNNQP